MTVYSNEEITEKLKVLQNWNLNNGAIERDFILKSFSAALAFIVQIGIEAEKMDHHPEIFNVYNKVKIRLNTHSVKGITDLDFDLAKKIEACYIK